jgi:hypothetical protein
MYVDTFHAFKSKKYEKYIYLYKYYFNGKVSKDFEPMVSLYKTSKIRHFQMPL